MYEPILREKLQTQLAPTHLEILNESPNHGLPASAEKHFRVIVVSEKFQDLSRIDRHRIVHDILALELRDHVHALAVQAFTPAEWLSKASKVITSPPCKH